MRHNTDRINSFHALSFTRHSALDAESRSTGRQRRKNAIHKRIQPSYRIPHFCGMTIPLTYLHYFHCLPFSFTPFLSPVIPRLVQIQKHRPTATEKHNSQTHTTVFLNTAFLRYDLAVSEQHSKRLEAKFFLYYFLTQTDEFYNFAHENRWA